MADMVAVVMILSLLSGSAMMAPMDTTYVLNRTETSSMKPTSSLLVRLVNGLSACSGRLEFFHEDQWGTVCDDSWDLNDAQVVCRELGCGRALQALYRGHFGEGSGIIWLDEVQCRGDERSLAECSNSGPGDHNCMHSEDAGVMCEGAPLGTTPDTTTADDQHNILPLEVQVVHFLLGRTGEVRGYTDRVKFDLVVDDNGLGFEKISHFGFDRDTGVFTAPFSGEYRLSLSAVPCQGSNGSVWVFLVNGRVEEGCMVHSGQVSGLCTHWTWLEAGDRLWMRQRYGCSWGVTFSGDSLESSWYDMFY